MISCSDLVKTSIDFLLDTSEILEENAEKEISLVTNDSRKTIKNSIFFAVNENAFKYLKDVFEKKPLFVVIDISFIENQEIKEFLSSDYGKYIVFSQNINIRKLYGIFVVNFYQLSEFQLDIVAVTGTNGKSSTAFFYKQICNFSGLKACSIGTIGIYSDDKEYKELKLTTPDISELSEILYEKACNKIYDIAIEASSHGLDQYRVDGLPITAVGFTNFSHDHLDYHKTIGDYWNAKSRLFEDVIDVNCIVVINNDDEKALEIKDICLERGLHYITYGIKNESDIQIEEYSLRKNFTYKIKINIFEKHYWFELKVLGEFQLYNLMLAIGLFHSTHPDRMEFVFFPDGGGEISELVAPPGRMEIIQHDENQDYIVIIDYAHTPDALENLMISIKQFSENKKILTVFGCGGDRDKNKRPKMGEIASKYSDYIILTDDNPRSENPDSIRSEIKYGMTDYKNFLEIQDRRNAIKKAIEMSDEYKIIVIAGKGHEKKQIINGVEYDFDDKEIASNFMKNNL